MKGFATNVGPEICREISDILLGVIGPMGMRNKSRGIAIGVMVLSVKR